MLWAAMVFGRIANDVFVGDPHPDDPIEFDRDRLVMQIS